MAAALQIWSPTFSRALDKLPPSIRVMVQEKADEMGTRLGTFPHQRLQGRPEFKLRIGDDRVLFEPSLCNVSECGVLLRRQRQIFYLVSKR